MSMYCIQFVQDSQVSACVLNQNSVGTSVDITTFFLMSHVANAKML